MNPIRVFHHQETRGSDDPDDLAADTAAIWAGLPRAVKKKIFDFMVGLRAEDNDEQAKEQDSD